MLYTINTCRYFGTRFEIDFCWNHYKILLCFQCFRIMISWDHFNWDSIFQVKAFYNVSQLWKYWRNLYKGKQCTCRCKEVVSSKLIFPCLCLGSLNLRKPNDCLKVLFTQSKLVLGIYRAREKKCWYNLDLMKPSR